MTIRVLEILGVSASMFAAACSQGAPGGVDSGSDETATIQAGQALESTDEASTDALESTDEALASIKDALESTGEVQQAQEVLNKYMLCYRIAFTSTKFGLSERFGGSTAASPRPGARGVAGDRSVKGVPGDW